jgi:quercetin dioxygenase-like cupin family protein
MAKPGQMDELDEAVETMMADPRAPLPRLNPRLAALLRVAADLRDLPREDFKARLKARLESATMDGGKPLATGDDIEARLKEMAGEPRMVAHDLRAALSGLPELTMRFLASLDGCTVGVSRFSGHANWERHPAADELLHFLEGDADIVTLTAAGPVRSLVREGSIFVCPRGLWHQVVPRSPVSLFFATPGEGTEHSADPEHEGRAAGVPAGAAAATLVGHHLRSATSGLAELAITPSTTAEEADAAVRTIASLDRRTLGVMRFSGETPWERHPDGDELLHALEGDVDVTVLTDDGPAHVLVHEGSVFVCPRGLWHRQRPRRAVTELFATPVDTTEISWADDPRRA